MGSQRGATCRATRGARCVGRESSEWAWAASQTKATHGRRSVHAAARQLQSHSRCSRSRASSDRRLSASPLPPLLPPALSRPRSIQQCHEKCRVELGDLARVELGQVDGQAALEPLVQACRARVQQSPARVTLGDSRTDLGVQQSPLGSLLQVGVSALYHVAWVSINFCSLFRPQV